MTILLDSAANGPSGLLASWQLPTVDVPGGDVLLVAFTQTRPDNALDLPADWTLREEIISGYDVDIRYALSDRFVAVSDTPYEDTFDLASGTSRWGAVQLAFRGTGSTPTNLVSVQHRFDPPNETDPTVTQAISTPAVGAVLLGYVSRTVDTGNVGTSFTWPAGWTVLEVIPGSGFIGQSEIAYRIADGTEASVAVDIHATLVASDVLIVAEYAIAHNAHPLPGVHIDWAEDGFDSGAHDDVTADVRSWTITRGVSGDLTGASGAGHGTIVLNNPDDKYNPENASSPLYAYLRDGPRVWIGVNEDGTVAYDAAKDIHGLGAGRITDITPIPAAGASDSPTVEIVFEDPLAWIGRAPTSIADSRTRSHYDLRLAVLTDIGEASHDLCEEPTTMPLSGADGLAGNVLDDINRASGTRHFAKPLDDATDWYAYTTIRRTANLDGASAATVNAGTQHVTSTSGWRKSADTVINQQRATVEPIEFTIGRPIVWEAETVPFTLNGSRVFWLEFDDFVDGPIADVNSTGSAVTTLLEPFGKTAKLTLTSAGTSSITSLNVQGSIARRGVAESYVVDDTSSQAAPRGVRAGPDLTGDLIGIGVSAKGMASHIVWRYADPKLRPDLVIENWFPTMFVLDLLDVLAVTSSQLAVTARLFEIVGLTHEGIHAGAQAIHHKVTYQLQESRVQEATSWFTWGVTEWGDADEPWAY